MPFWTRPDGDLCTDVPNVRRIMPFIMQKRNESAVFFEQLVDIAEADAFLERVRSEHGVRATLLHLIIYSAARVLHERPRLNRFVAGRRIWQRRGVWFSFSAKKAMSDDAPIVVVKKEIPEQASFLEVVRLLDAGVTDGRSDKKSSTDKELSLAFLLPTFLVNVVVRALFRLDAWGLLPGALIKSDPLYASAFVANLGSIGLDAAFHHLYEYGNIPIFAVLGKTAPTVVPDENGQPKVVRLMRVRYSFDERIEDGLYCVKGLERVKDMVEHPAKFISLS
jgi:hypothetical protein